MPMFATAAYNTSTLPIILHPQLRTTINVPGQTDSVDLTDQSLSDDIHSKPRNWLASNLFFFLWNVRSLLN